MEFQETFKLDLAPFRGTVTHYYIKADNYSTKGTFGGALTKDEIKPKISKRMIRDITEIKSDIDFYERRIIDAKENLKELKAKLHEAEYIRDKYNS